MCSLSGPQVMFICIHNFESIAQNVGVTAEYHIKNICEYMWCTAAAYLHIGISSHLSEIEHQ